MMIPAEVEVQDLVELMYILLQVAHSMADMVAISRIEIKSKEE